MGVFARSSIKKPRPAIGAIVGPVFAVSARAISAIAICAVAMQPRPSFGQAALPEVVVSASRVSLPAEQIGASVTIITEEDIARSQVRFVSELLRSVPGLAVNRAGGAGAITQLRIRGGESSHTLVLIDGIEVNDPSGGSEFNFAHLLAADVARIEVLRGPQSALYGSDAIGGVVNIITKRGRPGLTGALSARAGSFATNEFAASARGGVGKIFDFSASIARLDSNGISNADEDAGNSETDPYRNLTANGSLRVRPTPNVEIGAVGRAVYSKAEFDDFTGGIGAVDGENRRDNDQHYGRAYAKLSLGGLGDGLAWDHMVGASHTRSLSDNLVAGALDSEFDGFKTKFDYQTSLRVDEGGKLPGEHIFTVLVEHEEEQVEAVSAFTDVDREIRATSYAAEYRLGLFERLFLGASVRRDDNHVLFADKTSYQLTAAMLVNATDSRLHAAYGTGIKNPTLFELFGFAANFTGNPNLRPEESKGWDIGIEQKFWDGRLIVDATYFQNRITDLIAGAGTTAVNLDGENRVYGVELSAKAKLAPGWLAGASYSWTVGQDSTGTVLVRRPKHLVSANLERHFSIGGRAARAMLDLHYVAGNNDFAFDAFFNRSVVRLDDYLLVNLGAAISITDRAELFMRVENALDESYQESVSFGTPGISAFAGVRIRLGSSSP